MVDLLGINPACSWKQWLLVADNAEENKKQLKGCLGCRVA